MNPVSGRIILRSERWCLLGTTQSACLSYKVFEIGRGAVLSSCSSGRCDRFALLCSDSVE